VCVEGETYRGDGSANEIEQPEAAEGEELKCDPHQEASAFDPPGDRVRPGQVYREQNGGVFAVRHTNSHMDRPEESKDGCREEFRDDRICITDGDSEVTFARYERVPTVEGTAIIQWVTRWKMSRVAQAEGTQPQQRSREEYLHIYFPEHISEARETMRTYECDVEPFAEEEDSEGEWEERHGVRGEAGPPGALYHTGFAK
jgi:hypothetical protein